MKESKKRKLEAISKTVIEALKKKLKAPEDDPNHDIRNNEPAGCIDFPDGSVMEVWRCVACGKIPEHPNAPPIHVFSDSEDEEIYENPFAAFREGAYYFSSASKENREKLYINFQIQLRINKILAFTRH